MNAFGNSGMFDALRGGAPRPGAQFGSPGAPPSNVFPAPGGNPFQRPGDGQMSANVMPADGTTQVAPLPGLVGATNAPTAPSIGSPGMGWAMKDHGGRPEHRGFMPGFANGRFGEFMAALQAWREARPDFATMDPAARRAAIMDWIGGRPGFDAIRAGGPLPPIPGAPPASGPVIAPGQMPIAPGEPNPAAVSNMVGTSVGMSQPYNY